MVRIDKYKHLYLRLCKEYNIPLNLSGIDLNSVPIKYRSRHLTSFQESAFHKCWWDKMSTLLADDCNDLLVSLGCKPLTTENKKELKQEILDGYMYISLVGFLEKKYSNMTRRNIEEVLESFLRR